MHGNTTGAEMIQNPKQHAEMSQNPNPKRTVWSKAEAYQQPRRGKRCKPLDSDQMWVLQAALSALQLGVHPGRQQTPGFSQGSTGPQSA